MNIRQKLIQFAQNRQAIRQLNSLDNRQLADLGITRSEIQSAVRGQR